MKQMEDMGAARVVAGDMMNLDELRYALEGAGKVIIDGETVDLKAGDWVRISPAGKRQFFAAADTGMKYICIQVKENSLEAHSMCDGVIC